jgi:D-tyrosyl-tRNA(Tyr) deacylase
MRAVIQRVKNCSVRVEGKEVSRIGPGLLVLLGVSREDDAIDVDYLVEKLVNLRIFDDREGRLNRSLLEVGGEVMVVSQFTLYGDARKGRRPSYTGAATPERAEKLYRQFIETLRARDLSPAEGVFGSRMEVDLVNDGPVTLILSSPRESRPDFRGA